MGMALFNGDGKKSTLLNDGSIEQHEQLFTRKCYQLVENDINKHFWILIKQSKLWFIMISPFVYKGSCITFGYQSFLSRFPGHRAIKGSREGSVTASVRGAGRPFPGTPPRTSVKAFHG